MSILFLTLKTFSATGGIEKVGRVAGKAINEYAKAHDERVAVYSMYDSGKEITEPYLPKNIFKGFSANKFLFVLKSLQQGIKSRIVVVAHVNLLLPGFIIKFISPKTHLVLIAHGIEVWKPVSSKKKKMVLACDHILPVSRFTEEKMKTLYGIPGNKFTVINNCLDPYLPPPVVEGSRRKWREKYGMKEDAIVLMTLSRLTWHEKNKGYDKILVAIKELLPAFPRLQYLFVGKYDVAEKNRLDDFIHELGLDRRVFFTGFVSDDELAAHYDMADVYIMPSEKEGFGISFIEAMYYGKPVIAGNRDGTTDALLDGRLGVLVDPRSQVEITAAIKKVVEDIPAFNPDRELLMSYFSYDVYKGRWGEVLLPRRHSVYD